VCIASQWHAAAVIGGTTNATELGVLLPWGIAVDSAGNLFIAETSNHRIRRVDAATGVMTTIAGVGTAGWSGDGGPATSAQLDLPRGIAVDGLGNLYIADTFNQRIRKIDTTGTITTIAGTGTPSFDITDMFATAAALSSPAGVAVDGLGNVYIADTGNSAIRLVTTTGRIMTIAGDGTSGYLGDNGPAVMAELANPSGVAVDRQGNVLIADSGNSLIRRIDASTQRITTIAGNMLATDLGDNGPALAAQLASPSRVAVDGFGNLYIADTFNHRVRWVDAGGMITTIAGTGAPGFSGDGGAALSAQLYYPRDVALDQHGNIYIADQSNRRIRKIDASATITTAAGNGTSGQGDGGAATSIRMTPIGLGFDSHGNLFVTDSQNHRVGRIDPQGIFTTVAGNGSPGYTGDNAHATDASLNQPHALAIDAADRVFIADSNNYCIRRIDPDGSITTVAGTGTFGYNGDTGMATATELMTPTGVAVDPDGNIYIADTYNERIRLVDTSGMIHTIAGTGTGGYVADGVPATSAPLQNPAGVSVAANHDVYIVDSDNNRIRFVDHATGLIATIAGNGSGAFSGEGVAATTAMLWDPTSLTLDTSGGFYFADHNNQRIRHVDASKIITTVAGSSAIDSSGDGGPVTSAALSFPDAVATDSAGVVYIADSSNTRVRRIDPSGIVTTVAGKVDPEGVGPLAQAYLADPRALVVTPWGPLFAGGTSGTVQHVRLGSGWLSAVVGRYPQTYATGELARYQTRFFGDVGGIAFDAAAGRIYLTESSTNYVDVVTVVDPNNPATWTIATLAGDGNPGFFNGFGASSEFRSPSGLYLDGVNDRLLVADTGNHVVRAIDLVTGMVSTLAGTAATRGFYGDGGLATSALLFEPRAITRCANGDLFVADSGNHRVRRIDGASGVITTVLGDGVAASAGEGTPATAYPVDDPRGLACDANGNLYVTSTTAVRLVSADDHGVVDGSGPVETIFGTSPADAFPANVTRCLTGIAVSDPTNVEITDSCTGMLIAIHRQPR
jgi:sugar lactone lactonase YvrE